MASGLKTRIAKQLFLSSLQRLRSGSLELACPRETLLFGDSTSDLHATIAIEDEEFFWRAIAGGDTPELMREAHTLKGALKVIGAPTAAGLAEGLEALGRAGDTNGADKLGAALEREVDRLLQSLVASKRG